MKDLKTGHVVVIVAFLLCVTALTLTHSETSALILIGGAILAGIGIQVGQTTVLRDQTNGNQTKMLDNNRHALEAQEEHAKRTLELLETNQRQLVMLAGKLAEMSPMPIVAAVEPVPPAPPYIPDQQKRAA